MSRSHNRLTMHDTLYFAYGSNMDWQQLRTRCASARFMFSAQLPSHSLAFTRWSPRRKCGVLDIVPAPGDAVWGGVFRVDPAELRALDLCEAVFDGGYRRKHVCIMQSDSDSRTHNAIAYEVVKKLDKPQRPDAAYMAHVIRGAVHCGLPAEYIDRLRKLSQA